MIVASRVVVHIRSTPFPPQTKRPFHLCVFFVPAYEDERKLPCSMPLPENPPLGRLPFEPPEQSSPDLLEFWQLWREEKFWACHEALEEVWKREADAPRKQFLQGLIHGAVAIFQFRRGNFVGAARQYTRAWYRLYPSYPATPQRPDGRDGVDIRSFLVRIEAEIISSWPKLTDKERADLDVLEAQLKTQM